MKKFDYIDISMFFLILGCAIALFIIDFLLIKTYIF